MSGPYREPCVPATRSARTQRSAVRPHQAAISIAVVGDLGYHATALYADGAAPMAAWLVIHGLVVGAWAVLFLTFAVIDGEWPWEQR